VTLFLEPTEAVEADAVLVAGAEPVARSQWELFRRRFFHHRLAVFGLVMVILLAVACFTSQWWLPHSPTDQDVLLGTTAPGKSHWFGTDQLGRDYFARVMEGGKVSLRLGFFVALISTVVGATFGSLAGYFGGWVDQILMRLTDLFLIVPSIAILAIALKKFGNGPWIITFVLAGLVWMSIARVVRGQVLSIKEKEFIEAARAAGASNFRIITRHLLPNCIGPIMVNATLAIAAAIVAESTLSFLGYGVRPPKTSWGNMLSDAKGNYENDAFLLYFPGLFILLTVLCVNFIGDGLRDAFDPQAKR
jgi:peptide/nickel transport system permease protein